MEVKAKILKLFHFISDSIRSLIDIRDIFLFVGWGLFAYGLYLLAPWIGFSVGGFVLMIIALAMKGK